MSTRSGNRRVSRLLAAAMVFAAVTAHPSAAAAREFLWKVSGERGMVYLVGTVHLLTKDFYPLSSAMERAFAQSDLLVEEADLEELLAPSTQQKMLQRSMLPSTTSLDAVISPAALALVTTRVGELGLPLEPLKRFKPWALALTLASMEWQKAGFDGDLGLDRHFYDQARRSGKRIQGLETAEFQLSRFDEIPPEQQERLLVETLRDLDHEMTNLTSLVRAWKTGDVLQLERLVLEDVKQEPWMYQRLLVERNRTWMPAIEQLFSRPLPAFVAVGAAHLLGPDGLLASLAAKGYRVEQQ